MDTIFALATARGKAGVSIVRVSGPRAHTVVKRYCGTVPAPRLAALRSFRLLDGTLIDQALVVIFEEKQSFTGERVAEFHLHGSPAIVSAVLRALGDEDGLRPAEAGEFTRRALENQRLDIVEVEGLGDLIEAETEAQRQQAMRVFSGELGALVSDWRTRLIRAAALLEATIDFVDEDVPVDVFPEVRELVQSVLSDLERQVAGSRVAERVRNGFEVAIVGATNVGKSTLLNRLAGREAAITSKIAGTTRDVIEVRMDLRGIPVTILDTAGVRETSDPVESIGIDRTRQRALGADLRVFLLNDPSEVPAVDVAGDDIVLVGKSDILPQGDISGKTGQGVDRLVDRMIAVLELRVSGIGVATRERHRIAMSEAVDLLQDALAEVSRGPERTELAAEELRRAIAALDSLVGIVDVEHILDEIFSSFCVGK